MKRRFFDLGKDGYEEATVLEKAKLIVGEFQIMRQDHHIWSG
jgi:hypothetical protein